MDRLVRHKPEIKLRFFLVAAWYGLIAPFVTAGITWMLLTLIGPYDRRAHPWNERGFDPQEPVLQIAFCILLSCILACVVSLFGISRHGARVILWKALAGFVASCFFLWLVGEVSMAMVAPQ